MSCFSLEQAHLLEGDRHRLGAVDGDGHADVVDRRIRSIWKWVGLPSVAGVVAGGALVARDQRPSRTYTPDDIRARLHQRLDKLALPR